MPLGPGLVTQFTRMPSEPRSRPAARSDPLSRPGGDGAGASARPTRRAMQHVDNAPRPGARMPGMTACAAEECWPWFTAMRPRHQADVGSSGRWRSSWAASFTNTSHPPSACAAANASLGASMSMRSRAPMPPMPPVAATRRSGRPGWRAVRGAGPSRDRTGRSCPYPRPSAPSRPLRGHHRRRWRSAPSDPRCG